MTKRIKLTQGQFAIVCDCHYHLVAPFKWCAHWMPHEHSYRAARNESVKKAKKGTLIYMHSVINGTPPGMTTDHIDGDTLNNRCSNLRTATHQENQANRPKYRNNTSGYKGVWKHRSKWVAEIGGEKLGSFDSPEDAARAYDAVALEKYGRFARFNFPSSKSP